MQSVTDKNPASAIVPDTKSTAGKKEQVADMFNDIAGRYDFLNHFLSLGIDKAWRKKAISEVVAHNPSQILDVATGTGDMAIAASKAAPHATITGADIAAQMLDVGNKKIINLNLEKSITLQLADSEALPFPTASYDVVMCAYGVRNFAHLETGLREMHRVLRPGGKLVILEFSQPTMFPVKQLYNFYFRYILPTVGSILSKNKTAYSYLPESVNAFPDGIQFCNILRDCGFGNAKARPLTLGVTTLYTAGK